jgi:hypothetical protein
MSGRFKMRWLCVMLLAGALSAPSAAKACAVCFGEPSSPMALGLGWGIASLLGVVMLVLGSIASFFFYLAKRSARAAIATAPQASTLPNSPLPDL